MPSTPPASDAPPLFTAVSTSARQLFLLLRCIHISPKVQVQISASGLQFSTEEARVVHALAFLDQSLFASYSYNALPDPFQQRAPSPAGSEDGTLTTFQVSLPALLETLQIFAADPTFRGGASKDGRDPGGTNDMYSSSRKNLNPLDSRLLGMSGLCRLTYAHDGAPLTLELSEGNVTTTCSLSTYGAEEQDEIPLERDDLSMKIILRSSRLYDAIVELESTSPSRLTVSAGKSAPHFLLSSAGPLGSTSVEFSKDPALLETFEVSKRHSNTYRYALVRLAARAMALASKVSVRTDWQGVMSMQFMVELDGGEISFVDFRFLPLVEEDWDMDGAEDDEATM